MIRTEWSEHHTHLAVHSSSVTLPPTKGYDDHGQVSSVSLCHGRFQRFFQILGPPIYSFVDLGTMNLLKSHTLSQKLLLFQEIRLVFISFAGNQVVFHSFSPCKLHNAATKSPHSVRWVPRAPRGLWQITLGALNSGAGRMLATILSTKWENFNHIYIYIYIWGIDIIPTMVSNISSTSVKLSF